MGGGILKSVQHQATLILLLIVLYATACFQEARPACKSYTVLQKDTYYSIAKKFEVKLDRLYASNGIASANTPPVLKVGDKLCIPSKINISISQPTQAAQGTSEVTTKEVYHIVASNETIYSISQKYNVPATKIIAKNNIQNVKSLRVGQILSIDVKKESTATRVYSPTAKSSQAQSVTHNKAKPYIAKPSKTQTSTPPSIAKKEKAATKVKVTHSAPVKRKFLCGGIGFEPPLVNYEVTNSYRTSPDSVTKDGIVLSPKDSNAPVLASEDGLVIYSGSELKDYGNLIIIKHSSDGWFSIYGFLGSVERYRGDSVKKGETIARTSQSDNKIFFGIKKVKTPYNPLECLR